MNTDELDIDAIDLLVGLKAEVLEIRETISEEYMNKDSCFSTFIPRDEISENYATKYDIEQNLQLINELDDKYNDLKSSFQNYDVNQLGGYVTYSVYNSFNERTDRRLFRLESLEYSINESLPLFVTRSEINDAGYITEDQLSEKIGNIVTDGQLGNIVTKDYLESKNYLTEHQSLNQYATKSWVESRVGSYISEELPDIGKIFEMGNEFAQKSDIPTKTSDLFNDSGFITKHQSLDDYSKKSELNLLSSRIGNIEREVSSLKKEGYSLTLDDVDDYFKLQNLDKKYAKIDEIPNMRNYATIEYVMSNYVRDYEIPKKLSQLSNDMGFLTEHQSLTGYIKRDEAESKYAKKDDFPTKLSQLINDSGFIKQHQSLAGYVKRSELDDITEEILKIKSSVSQTGTDELTNEYIDRKINSLNFDSRYAKISDIPSLRNYVKIDHLYSNFVSRTDMPKKVSQLENDLGYITEHQSLDEYVKKEEKDNIVLRIGELESEFVNFKNTRNTSDVDYSAKISSLEKQIKDIIKSEITFDDIENRISMLDIENKYAKISDIPSIDDFVQKYYLETNYVKKNEIKEYNKKLDTIQSNIIDDFNSSLNNYTTKNEYNAFRENINTMISGLAGKSYIENYINNNFVRKGTVTTQVIHSSGISKEDAEFLATKEDLQSLSLRLNSYVQKDENVGIMKSSDAYRQFAKKEDVSRISRSLSSYATLKDVSSINRQITGMSSDILKSYYENEILSTKLESNYYTIEDIDKKLSEYVKSGTLSSYMKKTDVDKSVDMSKYATKSDLNKINITLSNYALLEDIPNLIEYLKIDDFEQHERDIYKYIDENNDYDTLLSPYAQKNYVDSIINSRLLNYVRRDDFNDSLSDYFRASDASVYIDSYVENNMSKIIKDNLDGVIDKYMTINQAEKTYLHIEDFVYLKNATMLNDKYVNDDEGFFDTFVNSDGTVKETQSLQNGFYIVKNNVFLIYNGTLYEFDKPQFNWKIEED